MLRIDKWTAIAIIFTAWALASMFTFKVEISLGSCDGAHPSSVSGPSSDQVSG